MDIDLMSLEHQIWKIKEQNVWALIYNANNAMHIYIRGHLDYKTVCKWHEMAFIKSPRIQRMQFPPKSVFRMASNNPIFRICGKKNPDELAFQ